MNIEVKMMSPSENAAWDTYVNSHPQATLYHLSGWKNVIEKTYGHKTYYLMAVKDSQKPPNYQLSLPGETQSLFNWGAMSQELGSNAVVGILPLVHLKHFLFGNNLISIPFFDIGGILADDVEIEKALLSEAIKLGHEIKANTIELRHLQPLTWLADSSQLTTHSSNSFAESYEQSTVSYMIKSHKVRMALELLESSQSLMKSLKPRLRTKIRKPMKEGLISKIGSLELLDDFYIVFAVNMRDLGSPVHSKELMKHVLEEFPSRGKIVMVYKDGQPMACSLIAGFKDILESPWVSALRKYTKFYPNILLYWTMLEYARDNGFTYFEFGRSTPGGGTYKFKEQWGAKATSLHWHYISLNDEATDEEIPEKSKFDRAIQYWKKLPVPVTKVIGPKIRKHIGL